MIRTRSVLTCIVALGALVALAPAASAATCSVSWTNTSGGLWTTATNWSTNAVPISTDNVCVTVAGTYTVTLPAPGTTVNSLTLGGTSGTQTLDIAGQDYNSGGETFNSTGLGLTNGGTINATGTLILDATSGGVTPLPGNAAGGPAILSVSAPLTNFGLIVSQTPDSAWKTYFSGTLTNEASGSIDVTSGTFVMPPGSSSGFGNTNNYAVTNDGSFMIAAGASLALTDGIASSGAFTNDGTVTNNGSITAFNQGGNVTWTQSGGSVSGNAVVLQGGATLADSAGAGQFLFDLAGGNLTGTIPAGQTVTIRGATFNSNGNNYSDTGVALGGATPVVNHGTLALDAPGTGTTSGGTTHLNSGTIDNFGTFVSTVEDTSWANHLNVGLVNEPGGTVNVATGNLDQDAAVPTTNHGIVTIAPGAQWALDEGGSFVNASDGTISPQIASASSVGTFQMTSPCCAGPGSVTAGGTLTPALVGGFVPSAGEEFQLFLLNGGQFSGTFASVTSGFTGDYGHESSSPAYVGVLFRPPTTVSGAKPPHVGSISVKNGKLRVKVSCPTGTPACSKLTVTATVTEHFKGKKITAITARTTKKKVVVIASSSVSLAAGAGKTLTLTLNRTGSRLLAKYGPLKTLVTFKSAGKTVKTVTVRLPKAAKVRKK